MVYILLAEGFEEAEALIPADLLRRAGLPVSLVGLNAATVAGGHGIAVAADLTLEQVVLSSQDMLLLPGGKGGVESMQMDLFALALIQKAHTVGCYLARHLRSPHPAGPPWAAGPPQRGLLPRHGGRDGLRRGPAGVSCGSGRTHHHRPLRRLRL